MTAPKESVYSALLKAQAAITPAEKNATNAFHRYDYVSADAMVDHCRRVLCDNGLTVSQLGVERLGDPNAEARSTEWLRVQYLAYHADSGTSHTWSHDFPAVSEKGRPSDKAVCGALTVNLSYAIRGLLLVPRSDENEPDKRDDRHYDPKARPAPAKVAPQSAPAEKPTVDIPPSWTSTDKGHDITKCERIFGEAKVEKSKATNGADVYSISVSGSERSVTARSFHRTPSLVAWKAGQGGESIEMAYMKGKYGNEVVYVGPHVNPAIEAAAKAMADEEIPF